MKQRILVALRDVKVREYGPLFVLTTQDEAKRLFISAAQDSKSQLGRFPRDYVMHELGLFDAETGRLTPHEVIADLTPYSELEAVLAQRESKCVHCAANAAMKEVKANG